MYAREIAIIRSLFAVQNAANIVQRPGSALYPLGSLQNSQTP